MWPCGQIELGIEANSLLDRDTFRAVEYPDERRNFLLNEAARELQADKQPCARVCFPDDKVVCLLAKVLRWNAEAMIRYLVEVGLGVRRLRWTRSTGISNLAHDSLSCTDAGQSPRN